MVPLGIDVDLAGIWDYIGLKTSFVRVDKISEGVAAAGPGKSAFCLLAATKDLEFERLTFGVKRTGATQLAGVKLTSGEQQDLVQSDARAACGWSS